MLAKEIKIGNIKRQREFIEDQLKHPNKDGNTAYRYVGQVLPEVIAYFEGEGYCVEHITSDMLTAATNGLPVYLFTIRDDVILNDKELKAAEEVELDADVDEMMDEISDMMFTLFGNGQ